MVICKRQSPHIRAVDKIQAGTSAYFSKLENCFTMTVITHPQGAHTHTHTQLSPSIEDTEVYKRARRVHSFIDGMQRQQFARETLWTVAPEITRVSDIILTSHRGVRWHLATVCQTNHYETVQPMGRLWQRGKLRTNIWSSGTFENVIHQNIWLSSEVKRRFEGMAVVIVNRTMRTPA